MLLTALMGSESRGGGMSLDIDDDVDVDIDGRRMYSVAQLIMAVDPVQLCTSECLVAQH